MATLDHRKYANGEERYRLRIRKRGHKEISLTFMEKNEAIIWLRIHQKQIDSDFDALRIDVERSRMIDRNRKIKGK